MTSRTAFRWWLIALLVCASAVPICVKYVDRAVADVCEAHVRQTLLWQWLNRLLTPLLLIAAVALFFLFFAGWEKISGRRMGKWARTPLLCSWSAIWALGTERVVKEICGRPGPDPMYLYHHVYTFHWLHGSPRWDSFPSGTVIVAVSIASVLWILHPRLRIPALLATLLASAGVVLANWHWVSDVIAGAFLGATIGWMTVSLGLRTSRENLVTSE